jgi:phosphoribosylamine--glycine ligase
VRVVVVGSGGREHAIVRALRRSRSVEEVLCAPGNPGIEADARLLDVAADDVGGLVAVATAQRPDLVVVGPEAPLVAGLVDELAAAGIAAFGPTAVAARLEGSKAYAKEAMSDAGVATGAWTRVEDVEAGMAAIESYPTVIKADGLAAGKGVVIAEDEQAARAALDDLLVDRRFGTQSVVVEEHLVGDELSLLAICDGERAVPLAPARDYKRIFDGDEGPNTGGMGAFSPVEAVDVDAICRTVHQPIVDLMREQGRPFHGVLYAGLMLTSAGIKVLEFNVRFGDPETQAVLPRLESDLGQLASAGYPESSSSGDHITGLEEVPPDIEVTHAGTARDADGRIVTAGGRVLNVTALGAEPATAREAAYAAASVIEFPGKQMRSDIALGAVAPTP